MEKDINNMTIRMPHQLFINGEFVNAEGEKIYKSINPNDGTVRDKTKQLQYIRGGTKVLFRTGINIRLQ